MKKPIGKGRRTAVKSISRKRRVGQTGQNMALPGSTHVTSPNANIFAELGFPPNEAANLKIRAELMIELLDIVADMPQGQAAAQLGVSQPRISHLARGKIDLFTIDTLVNMLAHAGASLRIAVKRPPRSAA